MEKKLEDLKTKVITMCQINASKGTFYIRALEDGDVITLQIMNKDTDWDDILRIK